MKKFLRFFQLLLIFSSFSFVFLCGIKVHASTNGHSQSDAVSWANSKVGQSMDLDGNGCWCVDLIAAYYEYLGQGRVWGNARDYVNGGKYTPSGWSYQSTPQPGDILVWTGGDYGHVAIVTSVNGGSSYTIVEQRYNNQEYVSRRNMTSYSGYTFIRPDFVKVNNPRICLDSVSSSSIGTITVSGWAFDADNYNTALSVHVYAYVNGQATFVGSTTANTSRPDVNNAYGCGNNHGFSATLPCPVSGSIQVNAAAINIGSGDNTWGEAKSVTVAADTTKPVISDVKVSNVSKNGYTVTCKVSDNVAIDRVSFPTWTENNGQDDLFSSWQTNSAALGTISNGVATYNVKISDHKGESNCYYITHIYAWDKAGNSTCVATNQYSCLYVKVQDVPKTANYKVYHYLENTDGTYKKTKTETFSGKTNSKVSPSPLTYTGFTSPSKKTATVKSDGSTVIKYYYTRNKYKLTWDLGGGKASGSYTKGSVYYATKITAPSSVKKTGYVFKGWSITVPDKMPAKNVTIKAKWEAKNQKEVEAYVTRFYKVFLNRKPEKEGLDYWTEALITKQMTGADVARGFVLSKEMNNRKLRNEEFVTLMYKGFFDRVPDASGYSYWVGLLEAGYPKEKVVAGFVNSQEFKNLCKKYNINPGSL